MSGGYTYPYRNWEILRRNSRGTFKVCIVMFGTQFCLIFNEGDDISLILQGQLWQAAVPATKWKKIVFVINGFDVENWTL